MAKSQSVDNAVKQVMKPSIDSLKEAISKVQVPSNVNSGTSRFIGQNPKPR